LVALAACALALQAGAAPAAANGRPNVLLIMTDDQRADDTMGVMPKTRQWFEDGGMRFSRAYATTPLCCPARASVFSGRYTHNHRVLTNDLAGALDQRYTIQAYLKAAGYRTGIFGKYFNAWNLLQNPPWFDDWGITTAGYEPFQVNDNGTVRTENTYVTSYIRDKALSFIDDSEAQDATPWFLNLWTTAPHSPYVPDTPYQSAAVPPFIPTPAASETDKRDKPPHVEASSVDMSAVESERAQQLRTLMSVDDMVEAVMQKLEATGEASNTLAIFFSDNGYMWGDHGLTAKGDPYDPAVRVPMYMRWPGQVVPAATDNRMVANVDIAPTIVDAVGGIAPPVPMDGRSLLDPMQNRTRLLTEHEGLLTEDGPGYGWSALRTPTSVYVEYYDGADHQRIEHREYYDLVADPFELENLLADNSAANDPPTAALSAQLAADRDCSGASCP
jgi:arylsulfatase A-like enzyme